MPAPEPFNGGPEPAVVRVIVCLDVDGVILPVCGRDPRAETGVPGGWWPRTAHTRVMGQDSWYSPDLVDRLNASATPLGVEVRWLTTREDDAPELLCPAIGLDGEHWRVQTRADEGPLRWWKASEMADLLARHPETRFVWVDDEIADLTAVTDPAVHAPDPYTARVAALVGHPRLHTISPDPSHGLTPQLMNDLDAHLTGLRRTIRVVSGP